MLGKKNWEVEVNVETPTWAICYWDVYAILIFIVTIWLLLIYWAKEFYRQKMILLK